MAVSPNLARLKKLLSDFTVGKINTDKSVSLMNSTIHLKGGGAVVQTNNKSEPVTLNRNAGKITMRGDDAMNSGDVRHFTLNNVYISEDSVVLLNLVDNTHGNKYIAWVTHLNNNGSCRITVEKISGGSETDAVVINFAVFHIQT